MAKKSNQKIVCMNCKEVLEKGDRYKIMNVGEKEPLCEDCYEEWEHEIVDARDWISLEQWDSQEEYIVK